MATTPVEICNLAIVRIGQRGELISSLTEATVAAEVCDVVYPLSRDAVLASFPWPFATRRVNLAVLAGAERGDWEFVYTLPIDCVTVLRVTPAVRSPGPDQRVPFELEDDANTGKVLLTDSALAELVYVARVELVTKYPPLFVQALAWKIAAELSMALPKDPKLAVLMEQKYMATLREAAAAEFRQSQEGPLPDSEFIRAR